MRKHRKLQRNAGKIRWITGLQTQKKNRGQMALLREGFSAGIAEDVLEGAGAEAMRNTNISVSYTHLDVYKRQASRERLLKR